MPACCRPFTDRDFTLYCRVFLAGMRQANGVWAVPVQTVAQKTQPMSLSDEDFCVPYLRITTEGTKVQEGRLAVSSLPLRSPRISRRDCVPRRYRWFP